MTCTLDYTVCNTEAEAISEARIIAAELNTIAWVAYVPNGKNWVAASMDCEWRPHWRMVASYRPHID